MSEEPSFSLAPNRVISGDSSRTIQPPPWEPSAPATSHMRTYVNGVEQPFIVRGAEEDEEEPAPQTVEALGLAQKQADKEAYRRLLDRMPRVRGLIMQAWGRISRAIRRCT